MTHSKAAKRFLDAGEEPTRALTPLEGYEKEKLVPLEDAVKSIDVPIHNLNAMVWTAKRNSQNPPDGLTPDQSAAIGLYTMEWPEGYENFYTLLNQKLRSEERKYLTPWFSYLRLFLTALYKLPSIKKTIWRGIRGNVSDLYNKDFIWWGVSSCTTTLQGMEKFMGRSGERTVFMIECINGKVIKSHSSYQDENEILLMPGTYVTVIEKWSPSENFYFIHLQEEIPPYQLLKPPSNLSLLSVDIPSLEQLQIPKTITSKTQLASVPSHEIKKVSSTSRTTIQHTVEHGVQYVSTDHQKQELMGINDRIKYIEQRKKQLQYILDQLRSKLDFDLANINQEKVEIRAKTVEFDLVFYKKLVEDLNQCSNEDKLKINSLESTLTENQRELEHLQRLMADSMSDIEKYRNEMKPLYEEISRLLIELDQQTMARIKVKIEKQTLEEQIPFLSAVHEQEMNELRNLSSPNIGIDPTTFYKNELQRAIREIRIDFENLSKSQRSELEEYYKIKTDEIIQQAQKQNDQLENSDQISVNNHHNQKEIFDLQQTILQLESQLKSIKQENVNLTETHEQEISELRSRLNQLTVAYDEAVSNNSLLEFQMDTYRRLLKSEEDHIKRVDDPSSNIKTTTTDAKTKIEYPSSPSLKPIITTVRDDKINQTEMEPKTAIKRSAKGSINIDECSLDGKYIILANSSKNKHIDLTGWNIIRKVDNSPEITYSIPSGFKLYSGKYVKIYAKGQGKEKSPYDLVLPTHHSWGIGDNIVTRLLNEQNEEKATHIKKTVYAS